MKKLGKGDKAPAPNATALGLSEAERFNKDMKLRGETNEKSQRPTAKNESVGSDRGTFKSKC